MKNCKTKRERNKSFSRRPFEEIDARDGNVFQKHFCCALHIAELIDAMKLKKGIPLKLNCGKDLFELKLSANNQRSTKIFILSLPSSPIFKLHTELNSEIFIANKYGKEERKENVQQQQRASEDTSDIINFYDHNNR